MKPFAIFAAMQQPNTRLFLVLEMIWWVVTAIIVAAVLYPLYSTVPDYPFLTGNVVFVVVFITFTRIIFLLKYTFLGYWQWVKVGVFILCLPLMFYLLAAFFQFKIYYDNYGLQGFFEHLAEPRRSAMMQYLFNETVFFGMGSMFVTLILPVRMLVSFWRVHNKRGL